MKRRFTLWAVVMLAFVMQALVGQSLGDFRSIATGNWGNTTTWETWDGGAWVAASAAPTTSDGAISIRNGHTVTIATSVSSDQVTIETGATVIVDVSITWTIADGAGTDLIVYGTLQNKNNVTLASTATAEFKSGSLYKHDRNGTGLPGVAAGTATWNVNSTIEVIGVTSSTGITLFKPTTHYGNVTWNCASQSATCNINSTLVFVDGNLKVQNTGTGIFRLYGAVSNQVLTIGGDLIIEAGTLQFGNGSTPSGSIDISGNYNQTGGTFNPNAGGSSFLRLNFKGTNKTFTNSGTITNTAINWFVKTGASLTLNNNIALANNRGDTVETGATLNLGTNTISGSTGTVFIVQSGGTLGIGSTDGITSSGATGNIQTATRTFSTGANYVYNGTSAQVTGTGLPSTVNDLSVDNSAGVTLTNDVTVSGTLTLTNGNFDLNGKTTSISAFAGTNGTVSQTQTLNAPSAVNVGGLGALITSGADLGSTVVKRGFSVQTGGSAQSIKRWYDITPTNNSSLDATLVIPYSEGAELNGISEANLVPFKSTDGGSSWTQQTGTLDQSGNKVTISGIGTFSRWTLGDQNNLMPVELVSFTASKKGNSVELNWKTATESNTAGFEVEKREKGEGRSETWNKVGFVEGAGTSSSAKNYSFTDKAGVGTFLYRLKQIDRSGEFTYSPTVEVTLGLMPNVMALASNYPNPFNPTTEIQYTLSPNLFAKAGAEKMLVTLKVYDALGREVAALVNEEKEAGTHFAKFNAQGFSSGVYYYRLNVNDFSIVNKMMLMK